MSSPKRLISVVSPAFMEEDVLPLYYGELVKVIDGMSYCYDWEIIFVDDGSSDGTLQVLKDLRKGDARVKWRSLSRNFGHQAALTAGIERVHGDAVIMMDSDLQHPVTLIPELVKQWESGFDIVLTIREDDPGLGILKRLTSFGFYRLINMMTKVPIKTASADFRLMSRKAVNAFLQFGEVHRFIRGMVCWMGYRVCEVPFKPDRRQAGQSKYSLRKMLSFAIDGLTSFSTAPLRIIAIIGFIICLMSLIYACYALIVWFQRPEELQSGWTSLLVSVHFLGGAILVSLGIIGEYIGRIYEQAKNRPIYFINEEDGFQ